MERFSKSTTEYRNQIIQELSDVPTTEDTRFLYLELASFFSHGFSIRQVVNYPKMLILKTWDASFDNSRFNKGIYNLDRLAVNEKTVDISLEEAELIENSLKNKPGVIAPIGIILDGYFCQLEFKCTKLNWNTNNEMNGSLSPLIKLLRQKTGIDYS